MLPRPPRGLVTWPRDRYALWSPELVVVGVSETLLPSLLQAVQGERPGSQIGAFLLSSRFHYLGFKQHRTAEGSVQPGMKLAKEARSANKNEGKEGRKTEVDIHCFSLFLCNFTLEKKHLVKLQDCLGSNTRCCDHSPFLQSSNSVTLMRGCSYIHY